MYRHLAVCKKRTTIVITWLQTSLTGLHIKMSTVIPSGKSSKDLQSQRTFVEQLRRELKVQRVKLSQCANELVQYCEQQGNVDPLVSPKASHDNPFRNSGSKCVLF